MIGQLAGLAAGVVVLTAGAGWLVKGASRLALAAGVTPLVIGLTIVAFGTSAPELAVSVAAASTGSAPLSAANVVGSNLFNVLAILGASALAAPLVVNRQLVRIDIPVMIGASVLFYVFAADGLIGLLDSLVLACLIVVYLVFLVSEARRDRARGGKAGPEAASGPEIAGPATSRRLAVAPNLALAAAGVLALVLGSRLLVWAAVGLARSFRVSETVIGLTVVAAGTSLPELATSVVAALKGARDIAIGNIIGSNIFNILLVLGISGLAAGGRLAVAPGLRAVDIPLMVVVALACLPMFRAGYTVSRANGAVFAGSYVLYVVWTILKAAASPALPVFNRLMFDLVFPALIVGMVVALVGSLRKEEEEGCEGGREDLPGPSA